MYLEYNWTACCYQPRFGDIFMDIRGERSWPSLEIARQALKAAGFKLGRKTNSRTWPILRRRDLTRAKKALRPRLDFVNCRGE